ncbi:MAG: 50S ribosomal protein L28 [Pseudomonadota bacterium]|jgi:large subunit ribosomal protein L28|nr:50S ribosomal protein L28 [Pseudomonadota bacterium]QKK05928.1 MAG: 50S ribosomal protein L28 [Pseudomonadota bacterium]|tara:strand:+ start:100 stop:387 length:288 start_codon:yes stop_codon:yes gene_type:complete
MTRLCKVTGKGVQSGNNVSHAHNKTRRRFLPNLQETSFYSETLKRKIRMRVSTSAIRTVEHKGGFDAYVLGTAASKLPAELRKIRRELLEKRNAA